MTTNDTAKLAVLNRANENAKLEAQAVLDQMFGYFSFAPAPAKREAERLAA